MDARLGVQVGEKNLFRGQRGKSRDPGVGSMGDGGGQGLMGKGGQKDRERERGRRGRMATGRGIKVLFKN